MAEVKETEKIPPLIIFIFLISVFFLFKGCDSSIYGYNNDDNLDEGSEGNDFMSNSMNVSDTYNTSNNDNGTIDTAEEEAEQDPLPPEFNQCNSSNYGMPTFEGTVREGEGCISSDDCLLYTTEGYVGTIVIQTSYSSPELECCLEDGTCGWE